MLGSGRLIRQFQWPDKADLREGISSISTGAGPCEGAHSLAENCEIEPLFKGIKKILLLEVALAGVE